MLRGPLLGSALLLCASVGLSPVTAAEPTPDRTPQQGPLHFVVHDVSARHARVGQPYQLTVHGWVAGDTGGTRFEKVHGPAWLQVGAHGRLHGRPTDQAAGRTVTVTVRARNDSGEQARLRVRIPVRTRGVHLVTRVKVMTWNLWLGGSQVKHGREKEMRYLLDHDIDVVGVQEAFEGATADLARRLGWFYARSGEDVGVLSRYPIVRRGPAHADEDYPMVNAVVRFDAHNQDQLSLWNTHLGYIPYGPYDACFGHYTIKHLLKREAQSHRTGQIRRVVHAMGPDLGRSRRTPVLLTGDFNAPSHLDWSAKTDRCGYRHGVPWPTSEIPTRAGLVDTFRAAHPDPLKVPGKTWSPIYKTFTGGYDHDSHTGEPEPQDRLDFVYAKGRWPVVSSRAVVAGHPRLEPDSAHNEWPSDHKGVITVFRVR